MATSKGKKISELEEIFDLSGVELIPLAINGSNYSVSPISLSAFVGSNLGYVSLSDDQTISGKKTFSDLVIATGYKTPGGTATQFLKADGSVDENTYLKIDENGNVELPNNSITLGDNTSEIFFGPLSISPVYQNFIGMYFTKLYSRFSGKEILRIEDDYGDYQSLSVDVYTLFNDTVQAKGVKVNNGKSTQFLKADGSLDETEYIDTDTNQVIEGTKTFASEIVLQNGLNCRENKFIRFNGMNVLHHYQGSTTLIATQNINLRPNGYNSIDAQVVIDTDGKVTANGYKIVEGEPSQFLKADGSVDETEYISADDMLTADEANTLYDTLYQEILEQYDEEPFPSPLASDLPSPTTLDNDEYEQ